MRAVRLDSLAPAMTMGKLTAEKSELSGRRLVDTVAAAIVLSQSCFSFFVGLMTQDDSRNQFTHTSRPAATESQPPSSLYPGSPGSLSADFVSLHVNHLVMLQGEVQPDVAPSLRASFDGLLLRTLEQIFTSNKLQ